MNAEFQRLDLKNICNGAAAELFERELDAVLQNIADPNAKAKVAREITIKVTILPTEDRSRGMVGVKCTSKLAPAADLETGVDFVQEGRKQVAYQREAPQGASVARIGG